MMRVVFTSSEEDKSLLKRELQNREEEQGRQIRGFREVLDVISGSHKPVVAYNNLNEFTSLHSKFIAPLPQSMAEFRCSLRMVFSRVIEVSHLWKGIGPLKKANSMAAASAYLKRQFFVPLDMEIPHTTEEDEATNHGFNVISLTCLFAKLASLLKLIHDQKKADIYDSLEDYTNIFYPYSRDVDEPLCHAEVLINNVEKVSPENLVFLWGFRSGCPAKELERQLRGVHDAFSHDFELRLVDKSCAVVAFRQPGMAMSLLQDIVSGGVSCRTLRKLISEGLKFAGYGVYKQVCISSVCEADLAECLDEVLLADPMSGFLMTSGREASEVHWCNDAVIRLDEL